MSRPVREVLELLEARPPAERRVALAWLAGRAVELDEDETRATLRRAELLLAAGGDPRRELDVEGRAVTAIADDLDSAERRERLEDTLAALATEAEGLASVASTLAELRAQPDLAWRCYAGALLAEAIGEG